MQHAFWTIDTAASDVLIKPRRRVGRYLNSTITSTQGSIHIENDALTDATIEFDLDLSPNQRSTFSPKISFKSVGFQKINANINFIKGILTMNNVSKMVEMEAVLTSLTQENGINKAGFEIYGTLTKREFGWNDHEPIMIDGFPLGQHINLTAHLEFTQYALAQ
ncbi:YceI family protein [Flavobacterium stagni]|jgi:polyisoprenoid-binding protein YceI|uniref:YceI family protein n=1 Tax=Flavobacterium stagni TaxID=2506421 RepID=A0A4Q1KD22_9FLAO|nr:YceI family protein [Flavobacterium stagni]RXR24566.1 YceI family protein [Flavobacterium stagni]